MKARTPSRKDLSIALMALQPSCPELDARSLLAAVRAYSPERDIVAGERRGQLLTVQETAARLRVSVPTVWRLLRTGDLPKVKVGKRSTRIPASAVIALGEGGKGS